MAAAAGLEPASFPVNGRASSPGRLSRNVAGTAGRSRTCGLCARNAVLCPLSYGGMASRWLGRQGSNLQRSFPLARLKVGCLQPIWTTPQFKDAWVWAVGFEPTTSWFQARNADHAALHPAQAPSKRHGGRGVESNAPSGFWRPVRRPWNMRGQNNEQRTSLAGAVGFEPTVEFLAQNEAPSSTRPHPSR